MEQENTYQQAVDKFIAALQELTQVGALRWSDGEDPALDLEIVIAPFCGVDKDGHWTPQYTLVVTTPDGELAPGLPCSETLFSHEDDVAADTRIKKLRESAMASARKEKP